MALSIYKIRVTWFFLKSTGTLFFTLGLALWFGSLVFFGIGVAPVHFNIAETWELTGTNPNLPGQPVVSQTVGGALTGASIQRLNYIEMGAAIGMTIGLILLWIPRNNQSRWLLAETITLLLSMTLLGIYMFYIGDRMFHIQQTVPLDFSITQETAKTAIQIEFDRLHQLYSTLVKCNVFLLFLQFVFLAFQVTSNRINRLIFSGPPRVHYEIVEAN